MPEAATLTETEQQKQTDKPEHHQTQAATGSPQAGGSSTAGSPVGGSGSTGSSVAGSTGASGPSISGGAPAGPQTSVSSGTDISGGRSSGLSRRRGGMSPASLLGNPLSMMRSLVDDLDHFFDDFLGFGGSPSRYRQPSSGTGSGSALQSTGGGYGTASLWYPQIEVSERGGNLVVCADLPGIRKEDVHLEVHDDYLVLEGERRQESEEDQGGVYRSERSYGRFYRTIPLPDGVNPEQVRANFKDGVLEVTVPMPSREQRQGRRIEIQQG
jgi:HSP20 family protein